MTRPILYRLGLAVSAAAFGAAPAAAQSIPAGAPPVAMGFGSALVMRGADLFVGRVGLVAGFPMPSTEAGSVHQFRRGTDGSWAEVTSVRPANGAPGDGFGTAVAVDGGLMAVGAPNHAPGGAVYLYERRGDSWSPVASVALPDGAGGDSFGRSVALDGGLLVVGAPGRDSSRGAVYAIRRNGGTLSAPVLVARGDRAGDRYGVAVAASGGTILAGAPGNLALGPGGAQGPVQAGRATMHRASGAAWSEVARLGPGADTAAAFGVAVWLQGGEALVGAPMAGGGTGVVFAFRAEAGGWAPAGRLVPASPAAGTGFGVAIARDGATALVGAPTTQGAVGAVHVFTGGAAGWTAAQVLAVPPAGLGLLFGMAVAVSGDAALVGSPLGDFFEGTGHAFARDAASGRWQPRGTVVNRSEGLERITGGEVRCDTGSVAGFSCQQVDLLSFLPTRELGARRGIMLNDIWGWTDSTSGREFALVGRMDGTSFVEVTDPANPRYLGDLPLHQGANPNLWRDIKVYRDHAFIVADGAGPHGMQVFDLTRLLRVSGAPVTFTEDAHYNRIASAHNIAINESTGYAYTIGNSGGGETCGGALHMIDIRNPKQPVFAGCFADPATGMQRTGYTHDNQCVTYRGPDTRFAGREVCFNASETAVGIADVTDKANPRPIAVAAYPNVGYAHQGWLSEDQRYYFLDDELDELSGSVPRTRTIVWDVQKLDEPVLVKEFLGTTGASDHNLYVRGNFMFQSNYVAGLRVIDISDPTNPREVGYFDTVPWGENAAGFAGSWSNYPYFRSGTIVFTSMREGLFVVRHRPRPMVP